MWATFKSSYQTTLAARQETFLAEYPRNVKMFLSVVALLLLVSPVYVNAFLEFQRRGLEAQADLQKPVIVPAHTDQQTALRDEQETASWMKSRQSSSLSDEEREAIRINDTDDRNARLQNAPDAELTEVTAKGLLPRISENGKTPWQTYARPFNPLDRRPRIAIVMADLGLAMEETDTVLQKLPAAVTLAFDVQSPVVGSWMGRARQTGHETLLSIPMEPFDYPRSDPGPNTLLTHLPNIENLQRFTWALRQGWGYVGVTTFSGSRFTADPNKMAPMIQSIKSRGLMVLDARLSPHSALYEMSKQNKIPVTRSTLQIDAIPSDEGIDAALRQLEKTAQISGMAIGIATPLPKTIEKLEAWIKKLPDNGLALAPLSSVVDQ